MTNPATDPGPVHSAHGPCTDCCSPFLLSYHGFTGGARSTQHFYKSYENSQH